jgi:sporulation protein YlmC with PRC-barrel domain
MIRKLLATTAVTALMATGAYAQDTTQPAQDPAMQTSPTQAPAAQPETPMVIKADGNLASNIIGKPVYNGTGDDAEKIGSVNDLVINPDGSIEALVIGVGGFLGIGQKDVAIEYELATWEERDNDRWLVVETTAEALKAQQEFDRQAYEPMPADADVAETKPATAEDLANAPAQEAGADETASTEQPADDQMSAQAPADDQSAAGTEQETAQAPADDQNATGTDETQTGAIDRSTLKEQPIDQISAEDFVGTTVYGANDENVGEIGDVILSQDGQIDAVLVDVGGFLGMGEKQVALGMDNLQFMADEDGDLYLYTNLTKEELEAQQAYDESTYAQNRDQMRMNVPATE